MGWRFRKSFSPLPGVRLNFSPRGVSTSVGAGPFRLYAGSQGAAITAHVPGTGISYRQPLQLPPSKGPQIHHDAPHFSQPEVASPSAITGKEIRSGSTSTLTTEGLEPVKQLLTKAQEERAQLLPELQASRKEAAWLRSRHQRWLNGWLFRRLFAGYFVQLGKNAEEAADKQAELEEQEKLSRLATEFDLSDDLKDCFGRLCDAVAALTQSQRIWKTLTVVATDRFRERTTASQSIQRRDVNVSLGSCDLIQTSWTVPRLMTAHGAEMFFYPAFVLYFISPQAFALVDIHEVRFNYSQASFIEEESVPNDAELLGHTWKKANKDGSPDRRFANNYQIPILKYGDIRLTSDSGLNEAYMISNERLAFGFAEAFSNFQRALPAVLGQS